MSLGLEGEPFDSVREPAPRSWPETRVHTFHAVAFAENFALRKLISIYPGAQRTSYRLQTVPPGGGKMFLYRFGAVVFHNVTPEERRSALSQLREAHPALTPVAIVDEDFTVVEDRASAPTMIGGSLRLDVLTPARANLIATSIAQSAAIEYYERLVDKMFSRLEGLVQRMAQRGTVSLGVRPLHRFIGEALATRSESLAVLHMLDTPHGVLEDPAVEPVYRELTGSFDLNNRHRSVLQKVGRVQEALELLLETARDTRMVLLDLAIVVLIVFQIAFAFT